MTRAISICIVSLLSLVLITPGVYGEVMRGGATLSSVSPVIKISREGNSLDSLVEGEILYIFTETGEPVSHIIIKDISSEVIHSEPLPDAVASQIRNTRSIMIFSNLREYGDFIKAFIEGSMDSFRDFITRYPDSELREEAQRIFDGLVYRPFKIQGTHQALDEFAKKYPDNFYFSRALKRRDDLQYIPVKAADRISEYRWFISTYSENTRVGEAKGRIRELLSLYEGVTLEEIARYPRSRMGQRVKFSSYLHSALPIYVEGPSVGRKTAQFKSPRNSTEYFNFQVVEKEITLWRLFINREDENLVNTILELKKGDHILVYGVIFDFLGGAPWIDVNDIEKY